MAPSTIGRSLKELAGWPSERFGGRGRSTSRRFAEPAREGGPDRSRSRGAGRTNDPRGSGIAVAWTCRACVGWRRRGAGPPNEPPGGRIAQCGRLQPAGQPQNQGGRQPPRPGCAIRRINTEVAAHWPRSRRRSRSTQKQELVKAFVTMAANIACGKPEAVRVQLQSRTGRAVPCRVYELAANSGWVSVGVDHDRPLCRQ